MIAELLIVLMLLKNTTKQFFRLYGLSDWVLLAFVQNVLWKSLEKEDFPQVYQILTPFWTVFSFHLVFA